MQLHAYSKDTQGQYLNATPEFIVFTRSESVADLLGKSDQDLPWHRCAKLIMAHDQLVMRSKQSHIFIEKPIIEGTQYVRRCFKSPLIGHTGKVIGISGMSVSVHPSTLIPLSAQQTACLKAFAMGGSCKEIGKQLGLSPRTVEHYLNTVKTKLHCTSKSALIVQAISRGLVQP